MNGHACRDFHIHHGGYKCVECGAVRPKALGPAEDKALPAAEDKGAQGPSREPVWPAEARRMSPGRKR
ncbi:MAG: hypothetical protein AAB368_03420 [bacterium]